MAANLTARVFLLLWLILFIGSFVIFAITAPTDFGFTRGLNRIEAFLGWQSMAALAGIGAWIFGRNFPKGSLWRWLSRIPVLIAGLLVAAIITLIVAVNFNKPSPDSPPPTNRPTTAPAQPVQPN